MNSGIRKQLLNNGWIEPLDNSPISTPTGWYRGSVVERQVGHWSRLWVNVDSELDEESEVDSYLAVEYDESFDEVVVAKYSEGHDGGYYHVEDVDSVSAPSGADDEKCAELAVRLMEKYP